MLELLIGLVAGFVSSIPPMGPVAVLVIRRALRERFREAAAIAVGATAAECVYVLLAILGVQALLESNPSLGAIFQGLGVVALAVVGLYFLFGGGRDEPDEPDAESRRGALTLGLTIGALNPTLPVTWSAATAALVAEPFFDFRGWTIVAFPLAVGVGKLCWFTIVVELLRRWGYKVEDHTVKMIVRVAGVALLGIATWYAHRLVTQGMLG